MDAMIRGWKGEKEPVWAELNGWMVAPLLKLVLIMKSIRFFPGGNPAIASPYDVPDW
jgi:hypothetical protein